MTSQRAPESFARPGRSVTAGMTLAMLAGLAWTGGMIWTIAGWAL
ncbi:morphogenic membrane protein MmpA [Streptomyces sp. CRN 30]